MTSGSVIFDPLLPWPVLWVACGLAALFIGLALWRGLKGWGLRALALAAVLLAIANPSLQIEDRDPLTDIVVLVVDESASQGIDVRPEQIASAIAGVEAEVAQLPNTELKIVRMGDSDGNRGSLVMEALSTALADEPRARLAGAILLTDGQVHDIERMPDMPAPLHTLLTGEDNDWDRRLVVRNAPAFAIIGEPVTLTLRVEDQGAVPDLPGLAEIEISVDGYEPQVFQVPIGEDLELPITLQHGGMNVIQLVLPEQEGELTNRNNAAAIQINGVRDRLRVLLVSGEPHAGERTWRNLLKSDASVDLVHFTILRPPEKQDGVPVNELSLIAFPTRELFLDKISEFDLIIFDRYKRRGILPTLYFDNVRQYVMDGGALLVAAGPDFASADSIYRTPLADILPAEPTGRVRDELFLPKVTEIGERHPVTEGLTPPDDETAEDALPWGRWMRLVDVSPLRGDVVMSGAEDRPLLMLDRPGEGRVALLASDHAWLWSRGFEGGGPQLELLRRLAHWMMKEPDLEEEALTATAEGQTMTITRRTLGDAVGEVEITGPDGSVVMVPLEEVSPGRFSADWTGPEMGLYRLKEGDMESVVALGPAAPKEFEETLATPDVLAEAVAATSGGIHRISDGIPDIRRTREGRAATGRGWIGITPREAYLTADIRVSPLLPAWAMLLIASMLAIGAWLWEGRR
ncbi:hypothetical protein EF888_03075 [Silicimonas algicola]|uniref:Glutamine amidotransferase n=1 Tax=Silicimonas algicola TaxID=1826607 RepID=A0A316GC56_9RHOB|nr:hypothetical protein [Silicimonas algicola]AZQ66199.1 hypothetical protein EF888_03075 [Silicimonas algicola]PWK58511.1 hypothetical protein C8D95_101325 [Silicimonas algicola]